MKLRISRSLLLSSILVSTAISLTPAAASAQSCTGYQWAGKASADQTWVGVSGDISVDSETIPNDIDYHILNYVDMNDNNNGCNGFQACWLQTGDSLGYTGQYPNDVGSYCQSSVIGAYMEESDVNAYYCGQFSSSQLPLAQTDEFEAYSTGETNANGDALVDGYAYNGTGWYPTGQAWLPNDAATQIFAQTEFDEFQGANSCPSLNNTESFGYGSYSLQQLSSANQWTYWTTSSTHYATEYPTGGFNPLTLSNRDLSGYDEFQVNG